jgi:hypothetical protein
MPSQYIPHIIYSIALTSVSIHLLIQRKAAVERRAHVDAQISILESIVHRIQNDKNVSDEEIEKLQKLARAHKGFGPSSEVAGAADEGIGWKDVILGTKKRDFGSDGLSDWDRKDLEERTFLVFLLFCKWIYIFS